MLIAVIKNHYAPQQPHLIPALRNLFATSIASSFSRVSVKHLSNWLDLPASEVASWAAGAQWSVEGEFVVVPKNEDNNVKAGIVKENVELSRECCCCVWWWGFG
jgi:translation initiation factor 3 subunit K